MEFDYSQILSNIRGNKYKCIGAGSGRIVFDMGNGYVVKAAMNIRGIAQNKAEFEIYSEAENDLFAKILHKSEHFMYIIMEKADRIKEISYVWNYFNVKSNKELFHIESIKDISTKYNLLFYDLGRAVNWGKIGEKPVIVDYGFTKQVMRRFY